MRPQLALKIDVDTFVGLRDGAPTLARLLDSRGLRGSFFVSCGPDHSGRAIRRVFRRGFLAKMLRTNAPSFYGWRTILYGTLLPGPQIARSFPDLLRRLADSGHEVGVHGYDHVYWHDRLDGLSPTATAEEFLRGLAVYRTSSEPTHVRSPHRAGSAPRRASRPSMRPGSSTTATRANRAVPARRRRTAVRHAGDSHHVADLDEVYGLEARRRGSSPTSSYGSSSRASTSTPFTPKPRA